MGHSRWDSNSTLRYSNYTKTIANTQSAHEVFTNRKLHESLNPKNLKVRESRDSEHNPNSTPIMIGLDVTGSMGMIAHEIAKSGLGTLFTEILDRSPVTDPHMMFLAIGDAACDESPIQVSQFEADARIIEQLTNIYVEGHGGGNATESYDFAWYVAAKHTSIDSFEKRGVKGYLFTIGDEEVPAGLTKEQIQRYMGYTPQVNKYRASELLTEAQEKYHVFHLIAEQGSYAQRALSRVKQGWRELMGARAILVDNYKNIPQIIISIIQVSEGATPEDVIASWQDKGVQSSVRHALMD